MGIQERISGCIKAERAVAEIYAQFAERFPEDARFWGGLAKEELEHERVFRSVEEFGPFEEDPADPVKLPPGLLIYKTLEYINDLKSRLATGALSRDEAFGTALRLEEACVESYLNEMQELVDMGGDGVEAVIEEERAHKDRILRYMHEQGLATYS
jgi:rubrerythrin